jgi:ketosteroid isomerase-like protein
MSQANVDRLRVALEAWNDADLDAYLAATNPDLVFYTSGAYLSHDPVYRGHDGLRKFWETFHDAWERLDIDVARLEDLDDRVLALGTFDAVGRKSGVRVRREFANLARFADGLIVELRAYGGWQEAREGVGLAG